MPGEKMRYMLQRMEAERQVCTDVETTSLKEGIEAVFSPGNIDDDCDRIAGLLYPYKVQIGEMLDKGEYHEAFTLFYEILESLSYHFVKDEHYCHFDDMYSPDYTCGDMLDVIVRKVKEEVVAESDLKYLSEVMRTKTMAVLLSSRTGNVFYGNLPSVIRITKSIKKDKI